MSDELEKWTTEKIENRKKGDWYTFDEIDIENQKRPQRPLKPTRNEDPIEDRIWIALMYEFMKVNDENIIFEQSHFKGMAQKLNKALPIRKGLALGTT